MGSQRIASAHATTAIPCTAEATSSRSRGLGREDDLGAGQRRDRECAARDPLIAPANADLTEVEAEEDERVEREAQQERCERGVQQPVDAVARRDDAREDRERLGELTKRGELARSGDDWILKGERVAA